MNTVKKDNIKKLNLLKTNLLLISLVVIIAVIPLVIRKSAEFSGADNKARDAITSINPDYKPWFNSIWVPPSGEIESLLFALQAGIGCLVMGYYLGFIHGRKKNVDAEDK
jgi:cobalt/nickel transport protein